MILYVIRHGDPDYSTDTLTPKGKLQAQALAKKTGSLWCRCCLFIPFGKGKRNSKGNL